MRIWLILAAVVILGGGTIALTLSRGGQPDFDIAYSAVESAPIKMTIETNGTVEPLSTVQVGCEVTGRIVELSTDHDEPVKKDQIICRIDPELPKAENEQSQADYFKAESALADAKLARDEQIANLPVRTKQALAQKQEADAALIDAEYNWHRIDELKKNNTASESEWVGRKSGWQRAQANVTAAEAAYQLAVNNEKILVGRAGQAVAQAEAALKLAKARLDFTTTRVDRCIIRSPIDGIVLKRYFDVGTTVTATFQTPVLFLLAPSLDQMRISAKVSESDISYIEVGQAARFTVEAKQPTTFEGKILHKRNQPDTIQNVVTYTVLFEVQNDAHHTLIPGLSVNVAIECVSKANVPQIANAALRFKPPLDAASRQAVIADLQWPEKPMADANGGPADYCQQSYAWTFDESARQWRAVPLWTGVTNNVGTEILVGAKSGDRFVKKFIEKSSAGFSFKDALKLAQPGNRSI